MLNRAIIFVRRGAAYGIGHVGWAFAEDNDVFSAGAVENHGGGLHTSPKEMGFWARRTRDPITPMRARHYDEFKVIDLAQADPMGAKRVVAWVHQHAYEAFGRNCKDDAYDVLRAYGIQNLPVPAHHWEPNHWFNQVQGTHYQIDGDGVAPEDDKMKPAMSDAVEPDLDSLNDSPYLEEKPSAPTWRTSETEAFRAFQLAIEAALPMAVTANLRNQPPIQGLLGRLLRLLGLENR